jgi:hypothetical protein
MTRSITCTTPLSQTISALTTVAFFTSKGSLRRIGIGAPSKDGHSLWCTSQHVVLEDSSQLGFKEATVGLQVLGIRVV